MPLSEFTLLLYESLVIAFCFIFLKKYLTNSELFIGDRRFCDLKQTPQRKGFRDHRHDQSIWSIICKMNKVTILTHDKNPIYQSHYRE